jgi:hypothetical protein
MAPVAESWAASDAERMKTRKTARIGIPPADEMSSDECRAFYRKRAEWETRIIINMGGLGLVVMSGGLFWDLCRSGNGGLKSRF